MPRPDPNSPLGFSLSLLSHRLGSLLLDLTHHLDDLPPGVADEVSGDLLHAARLVARVSLRVRGQVPPDRGH